ncbi:NAD(P)-dependent oxidoreductase [Ottowia pentelensis]
MDAPALRARLYKTEALVVPPWLRVDATLLDFAPRLLALGRIHEGGDNLDFEACQRRGVRVIQATSATARATAEFLLTALLGLFRMGGNLNVGFSMGGPQSPGREINDSVIGLFGLSAPAQMLAPMLVALGARVLGYDPALHRSAELWARLGVQPLSLAEMLQAADAVSMQTVYASRYRGLVGERVLQSCKPGQLWVSASRAALFDLDALAQALRSGRITACWLDSDDEVLAQPGQPLRGLPSVRITPRLAPRTHEAYLRGSWYLADRLHQTLEFSAQHGGGWRGPSTAPMALG